MHNNFCGHSDREEPSTSRYAIRLSSSAAFEIYSFGACTNAAGNKFTRCGLVYVGAKTTTVINGANAWNENPNHFENFYIAVELGDTTNVTATSGSTRIADMRGYSSGTMSSL